MPTTRAGSRTSPTAGPPKSKLSNTQYFLLAERATLTVVFRHTGDPRKVPVIPIDVGQSRYLVSPYGESDWVRHYRAAGTGELSRKGQTEVFQAAEVPVDERRVVIARTATSPGAFVGPCFTKLRDARDHPLFHIVHGR